MRLDDGLSIIAGVMIFFSWPCFRATGTLIEALEMMSAVW
jgi:hypothetical protein